MDEQLDNILQIDPDTTRTVAKNVVEQAAELIHAEVVDTPAVLSPSPAPALPAPVDPHTEDLNDDVEFAREQIKQLIDDGRSAMNGAMELAAAGDAPRAYEVVATLLTAVVQANKELIHIHKTRKDALKAEKEAQSLAQGSGPASVNIDKAVFVGRASDLLRELQTIKKATNAALKKDDAA